MDFKRFCFYVNFLFIFIPILILTGCDNKRPVKLKFIDQARLVDLPIPPGVSPVNLNYKDFNNSIDQVISLSFKTNLSYGQIEKFYLEQMELSGWHLAWNAPSQQSCFIFQKPNRVCVIIIESDLDSNSTKKSEVRLISGPR